MANQEVNYSGYDPSFMKIRSIEERQRILNERMILIGQNLVDTKEELTEKNLSLKREIESLKQIVERMASIVDNLSSEYSKLARKEELELLIKQAKMFQPMEFATKKDLESLKKRE